MSSKIRIKRICQFCNSEFIAKTTVTKYCGDNCAKRAYKKRKREEKISLSNAETTEIIQRPIIEIQSKEFLSIQETSTLLNISRTSIWRMIKASKIKSAKIGRRVIIKKADLNQLFS